MTTFSWGVNRFRVFLDMGKPPLEIVSHSSKRFIPFRLEPNTRASWARLAQECQWGVEPISRRRYT
jgi:hypothetical protein